MSTSAAMHKYSRFTLFRYAGVPEIKVVVILKRATNYPEFGGPARLSTGPAPARASFESRVFKQHLVVVPLAEVKICSHDRRKRPLFTNSHRLQGGHSQPVIGCTTGTVL